jgi:hypothetical protein
MNSARTTWAVSAFLLLVTLARLQATEPLESADSTALERPLCLLVCGGAGRLQVPVRPGTRFQKTSIWPSLTRGTISGRLDLVRGQYVGSLTIEVETELIRVQGKKPFTLEPDKPQRVDKYFDWSVVLTRSPEKWDCRPLGWLVPIDKR